jgi:hypothetical protein
VAAKGGWVAAFLAENTGLLLDSRGGVVENDGLFGGSR